MGTRNPVDVTATDECARRLGYGSNRHPHRLVEIPMNFYNEIDPFAAAWLRELIKAGHIAPGIVDERSIEDVKPNELRKFTQCHFFAGIGVWSYALRQAGWPDDRPVWTGSCPCQPFSAAGKRTGTADERHLWPSLFHHISQLRPLVFFGEQVASKDGLAWFDIVSDDLEAASYAVGSADLCAAGFGAPHIRQRLYFVADNKQHERRQECPDVRGCQEGSPSQGLEQRPLYGSSGELDNGGETLSKSQRPSDVSFWQASDQIRCIDGRTRPVEPGTFPLAHGATNRVGRLRGYGNAIVAPVAEAFIRAYLESEELR